MNLRYVYLSFLLSSIIALLLSCNEPEKELCIRDLKFTFQTNVENLNDTINLFDTLWLSISVDSLIEDEITGEMINLFLNDKMEYWGLPIDNIDSLDLNAAANFEFINRKGEIILFQNQVYSELYFKFEEANGERVVEIGIVPLRVGAFFCTINISLNEYERQINVYDERCAIIRVKHRFQTNIEDIEGNNFYLVEDSPYPGYQSYAKEDFDMYGGFAFYVKE